MRTWTLTTLVLAACGTDPAGEGGPSGDGSADPSRCASPSWVEPPACGSGPVDRRAALPGPGAPGHDGALAAKVRRADRLFHAVMSASTGVNQEAVVLSSDTAARQALASFLDDHDGWDLEDAVGVAPAELVASSGWTKAAGAYAGVGIAADALRYGTLRDEGAACAEVDVARDQLLRGLDGLHLAHALAGVDGVVARGFVRVDHPGYGEGVETTPLFDGDGSPLPEEKDNGTWRDDPSGENPGWVWEDSCSRDMLMGWVAAYGFAWEVVRLDPTIPEAVKARMQADARGLARSLMEVRADGYDLEIVDADGRRTFHGILHEESIDRFYAPGAANGPNAAMALGAVASLALVAEDPEVDAWLAEELLARRGLPRIVADAVHAVDFGTFSNFSGYNMAFVGGLLAGRYLCDDDARATVQGALDLGLYARPGQDRQPAEQGQSLYDAAALFARSGTWAFGPAERPLDDDVLAAGVSSLAGFPQAPAWDVEVVNCDEGEVASGDCVGVDGTPIAVLDVRGWNDEVIAAEALPFAIRPPSNYHWRSNPYRVNGGGAGQTLLPQPDLRFAYWMLRWVRPDGPATDGPPTRAGRLRGR